MSFTKPGSRGNLLLDILTISSSTEDDSSEDADIIETTKQESRIVRSHSDSPSSNSLSEEELIEENETWEVEDNSMKYLAVHYDSNLKSAAEVLHNENNSDKQTFLSDPKVDETNKDEDHPIKNSTMNYESSADAEVISSKNGTGEQTFQFVPKESKTAEEEDNSMNDSIFNPSSSSTPNLKPPAVANNNFENNTESVDVTSRENDTATGEYNSVSNFTLDYDLPSQSSKTAERKNNKHTQQVSSAENVFHHPSIPIPVEILPPTYEQQENFVNINPCETIPDQTNRPQLSIFINDAGTELRITLPESITNICVCPSSSTSFRQYGGLRVRGGRRGHTSRGAYTGNSEYSGFNPDASVKPEDDENLNYDPFKQERFFYRNGVASRSQRVRGSGRARRPRGSRGQQTETRHVTGEGGDVIKKSRGRPRLHPIKVPLSSYYTLPDGSVKRRRGRPSTTYEPAIHVPMGISLHNNVVIADCMEMKVESPKDNLRYQVEVPDEDIIFIKQTPVLDDCVVIKESPVKKGKILTEPNSNSPQKLLPKGLTKIAKISPPNITNKEVDSVDTANVSFKTVTSKDLKILLKNMPKKESVAGRSLKAAASNKILPDSSKTSLKTSNSKETVGEVAEMSPKVKAAGASPKKLSKNRKRNIVEEATPTIENDEKNAKTARKSNVKNQIYNSCPARRTSLRSKKLKTP